MAFDPMAHVLAGRPQRGTPRTAPIRLPEPASPAPETTTPTRPTRPAVPAMGMTEAEFARHIQETHNES